MPPTVIAWADGGCRGNPGGPGGWGAVLVHVATGATLECRGGELDTTNNRMELAGALAALTNLTSAPVDVEVRSDSRYVVQMVEAWIPGWRARGWRKKDGKPVLNIELVMALDTAARNHKTRFRWVKGHANEPGNVRADALANDAMDELMAGRDPANSRRLDRPGFSFNLD